MWVMKILKTALTIAFTLRLIEYEEEKDEIIYMMNASKEKWEEVLMQKKKWKVSSYYLLWKQTLIRNQEKIWC